MPTRKGREMNEANCVTGLDNVLWECFRHFVHLDESNAAMHCGLVRYSPLTFRLAEQLDAFPNDIREFLHPRNIPILDDVLAHRNQYEEDRCDTFISGVGRCTQPRGHPMGYHSALAEGADSKRVEK